MILFYNFLLEKGFTSVNKSLGTGKRNFLLKKFLIFSLHLWLDMKMSPLSKMWLKLHKKCGAEEILVVIKERVLYRLLSVG